MKPSLLVSLVSDQTIPNVQLIKEFNEVSEYLFITTPSMESKGVRNWIEYTCGIENKSNILVVDQYSFNDIDSKLKTFSFDRYEQIYVNLTGGTKIMTLVTSDFFKDLGADIYYVTGNNNEYFKVFPKRNNQLISFESQISLLDFLHSYGISIDNRDRKSMNTYETAEKIFEEYCSNSFQKQYLDAIKFLNEMRNNKKGVKETDFSKIEAFIEQICYKPFTDGKLSFGEVKYLSGEWFEEYIGLRLMKELQLTDDNLVIGRQIKKEHRKQSQINNHGELLGDDANLSGDSFNNEMDVMFLYKGRFYSIECKTSIIAYYKDKSQKEKTRNILGETIYKTDSIKNRFGLFPQTSIVTLTDFHDYWKTDSDTSQQKNKCRSLEELIYRANLSNIKLIDRKMLQNAQTLLPLLNGNTQ